MKKMIVNIIELIFIFLLTYTVFNYMVIPVNIVGSSMENSLHDGNIALINGMVNSEDDIDRFDIVIAHSSLLNEDIVKRVIGLPGDHLQMINDTLYINGQVFDESYLDVQFINDSKLKYNSELFTHDFEVILEDNQYYLLGDNRLNSKDSRVLGPFSLEDIIGVGGIVIYPFEDIEWINS